MIMIDGERNIRGVRMKVYLIVEVDSYHFEYVTHKCFTSREKAEKYCVERNDDTYNYLQQCADEYEKPGNFIISEVREIEVIE